MPMTKEEATDFFAVIYRGKHHIPDPNYEPKPFGCGWCVNDHGDLSTYDFNTLSRLVFLAHDRACRVSIMSSGPRMVKIIVWKRARNTGSMTTTHPTLDEAIRLWRVAHPETEIVL